MVLPEDMLAMQISSDIKNHELSEIWSKLIAMVCDQDIAKGTFAKEDFHQEDFKFETQELNNMEP
jgi:hypothetical protein